MVVMVSTHPDLDSVTILDVSDPAPAPSSADWNEDGVVILPNLIDLDLIRRYQYDWVEYNDHCGGTFEFYDRENGGVLDVYRPGGWPDCTPYMRHPALRELVCDGRIATELERLLGEPAGVHLNLTGWVSTERNWHQDTYLNPPHVGDYYAAVWIALGDIHPDSGPFQYVPGSHQWFEITQAKIGRYFDLSDPRWPKHSEQILTELLEHEIEQRQAEVITYLPNQGDVLIWHGRLVHRGSVANLPGMYRPALIAHYSGINHRQDMPTAEYHEAGGWFFPLGGGQPVM